MSVFEILDKAQVAPLFEGWQETMIWSCLQDCMGSAYGEAQLHPHSALIQIADFNFFAGVPNRELLCHQQNPGALLIPQDETWAALIEEVYGPRVSRLLRYAFHKDSVGFDRAKLEAFAASLPSGYALCPIKSTLYRQITASDWAGDLCSQFRDEADYAARGLGVAVVQEGILVAGASSYTIYKGGIEVEIDTRPDMRRLGLARACGAQLILDCLSRGLYPSWDAHNAASAALAAQLGYRLSGTYPAYELLT